MKLYSGNRREQIANRKRQYIRATWYAAHSLERLGRRAKAHAETYREAYDFTMPGRL